MKKSKWIAGAILLMSVLGIGITAKLPGFMAEDVCAQSLQPRVVDEADVLTDQEESLLLEKLDEISERQQLDVVVATVRSLNGLSVQQRADDFYYYNGYGYGDFRDGILLLQCPQERDLWISTNGYGIDAFTDAGQEYIWNEILPDFRNDNYAKGYMRFAELCDDFISRARSGNRYDLGNMPAKKKSPLRFLWALVIGAAGSFTMGQSKKAKLKSVHRKHTADRYTPNGGLHLFVKEDRLIDRRVVTRRIQQPRPSGGGGGGSSTHMGSSGSMHGGSGRKY